MAGPMHPLLQREADPPVDALIELSPHARLPRLDLGIDWETPGQEFRTSLASVFKGPHPPADSELAEIRDFRVDWIRGRLPFRAFTASSVWHIGLVWLLLLPLWGFLPRSTPTLAPVHIELAWYSAPADLPPISLPAATLKRVAPRSHRTEATKPADERGADALHPRQTILSIPVRVTHPRQTLIRPDAPDAPPKIVPQLPNIVQWNAPQLQMPKFQLSASAVAPKLQQRALQESAVPEVPNTQKTSGPLNIAPTAVVIARPQIPLSAMSAPVARQHDAVTNAAAPEIGGAPNESSPRNVIALSATPGPPIPVPSVPEGNLAARISISPAGTKPGEPGGSENRTAGGATGGGGATPGAGSLPAAISISGGIEPRTTGGGGIAAGGGRSGRLNLKPTTPYQPSIDTRRVPINAVALDPTLPPEKILGSEVYTMHVNRPNLTSATGSWILSFAELDEGKDPSLKHKDPLAGPVAMQTADPKYPPELIKGHVKGEVVLYAIIRKDGSVDSIQIVRGLDPQLDRNAIDAFKQWTFLPATRAKAPVDAEVVIHVPFQYRDPHDYAPQQ